jgi:hypothetical protein
MAGMEILVLGLCRTGTMCEYPALDIKFHL